MFGLNKIGFLIPNSCSSIVGISYGMSSKSGMISLLKWHVATTARSGTYLYLLFQSRNCDTSPFVVRTGGKLNLGKLYLTLESVFLKS